MPSWRTGQSGAGGDNRDGELGDGTTTSRLTPVQVVGLTDVAEISAGSFHTCARRTDGTVYCWGSNLAGQLGNAGGDSPEPVALSGIANTVAIGAGAEHSCALLADGSGRCWGNNSFGQLGNGGTSDSTAPVLLGSAQAA